VAFSKYENDDVMQSDAMDRLIRLAYTIPEAYKSLLDKAALSNDRNVIYLVKWQTVTKEDNGKTFSMYSYANDEMNLPTINTGQANWSDCIQC